MIIPKTFKLFDQEIKVKMVPDLEYKTDSVGEARYRDNTILIQKDSKGRPALRSLQEQWFCHELVHHIFYQLKETELRNNEKLVDQIGSLIHQFLNTQRGSEK